MDKLGRQPNTVKNSFELGKKLDEAEKQVKEGKYYSWEEVKSKLDAQVKNWEKPHYKYIILPFWRGVHFIKEIPMNIKRFWQRGLRGFSEIDVWSFDCYLSKIISEGTKQLSVNNHGFPEKLFQECDQNDEKAAEKWKNILLVISEGFRLRLKMIEGLEEITEGQKEQIKKAMNLFVEYYDSLWD